MPIHIKKTHKIFFLFEIVTNIESSYLHFRYSSGIAKNLNNDLSVVQ
jgi:hypothetical protein